MFVFVTFTRVFEGRCELNLTTGVLVIKALTLQDSGEYKAEINYMRAGSIHVTVLGKWANHGVEAGGCVLKCFYNSNSL